MMNASARMMESFQHGLLTIAKVRSGGQQTVVVQHVNVGDGGRAMVAGQVKLRGKRRCAKQAKMEGSERKMSDNPMDRLPDWRMTLPLAQACPALRRADPSGTIVPVSCDGQWPMPSTRWRLTWRPTRRGPRHVEAWPAVDRGRRASSEDDGRDAEDTSEMRELARG